MHNKKGQNSGNQESQALFKKLFWVFGVQPMRGMLDALQMGLWEVLQDQGKVPVQAVIRAFPPQKEGGALIAGRCGQGFPNLRQLVLEHRIVEAQAQFSLFHPIQALGQKLSDRKALQALGQNLIGLAPALDLIEVQGAQGIEDQLEIARASCRKKEVT